MSKIIIFGIGDIGELAYYYFTNDSDYEVTAFTVNKEYMNNGSFCDCPVVEFESIEEEFSPKEYKMFIAVSYAKVNQVRTQKYNEAKEKGYELVSYISSKATVFENVLIGDNCFILENTTVQPFVKIGNNVTVWSGSHIGHHSEIKDNCFITPNVAISGGVTVEPYCFIGVNATIRNHIKIDQSTVISAGATIMKDTEKYGVYLGRSAELYRLPSNKLRSL